MYLILLLLLFEPILRYMVSSINIKIPYRLFILALFISIQIHGHFQIFALLGWISTLILIYDFFCDYYSNNEIIDNV
jgi:hypothetical protein